MTSKVADTAFLSGGGQLGALMRRHDWAATGLGAPKTWPQSLRTAVRLILNTGHPMYIFWGPDGACFYNDAYRQSIGPERHPCSLGKPARQVWAEIWDIIGPQIEQVMAGRGATWHENALVPITRNGAVEDVYWTYSYGPIDDETALNSVGGVLVVCTETTRTVLAERRQADEMKRQQLLFEQAPGFICILRGPNHVFEFVNATHRKLFASDGWIGKPVREAFPDLAGQGFYELLDQVYSTGERFVATAAPVRFRRSPEDDEKTRYADFIYAPLIDPGGEITGIFCEGFDVTEQRQTEEALGESKEQLRFATEAAEIGLWDVDLVNDTLFWPARVKAMFGISPDAPVSMADFYAGLHPDDREFVSAAFARAADPARRALYDVEYRTIGKEDSIIRWVAAKGRGIFDQQANCHRVIGTAIDISRRKLNEEKLRRLNQDLEREIAVRIAERERLWRVARDLLVIIDTRGIFCAVNPAVQLTLGWEPEDMIGRAVYDFVVADDHAATHAALAHAASKELAPFENRYRHKDGGFRWISWVAAPEGALIYASGRHITVEKEREAALAEAQEQIRQAQQIEAIGQLTGGVAHDFNNLLMVISGGLSILDSQSDPQRRARILDGMRQATDRGAGLSRQLLSFSRRQPLKPVPIDIVRRIGSMGELLNRTLRGDVTVDTEFADDLWPVMADPVELELVLLNLCVNARDAMPEGGTVTIRGENRPALRHGDPRCDFVALSVTDTGVGMPSEVLAQVFKPFFTTKEIGKGSGLGLAQVHGFVTQSGGAVEIDSRVGHGTTVRMFLQRSLEQPKYDDRPLIKLPASRRASFGRGAVLVVEDDDQVAALVREMLRELDYDVIRTATADEALSVLGNGRIVDVVFSDVMMAGTMNGIALAREIRRRDARIPIVLTSGYTGPSDHRVGLEGIQMLTKPYVLSVLEQALMEAMSARPAG